MKDNAKLYYLSGAIISTVYAISFVRLINLIESLMHNKSRIYKDKGERAL